MMRSQNVKKLGDREKSSNGSHMSSKKAAVKEMGDREKSSKQRRQGTCAVVCAWEVLGFRGGRVALTMLLSALMTGADETWVRPYSRPAGLRDPKKSGAGTVSGCPQWLSLYV